MPPTTATGDIHSKRRDAVASLRFSDPSPSHACAEAVQVANSRSETGERLASGCFPIIQAFS